MKRNTALLALLAVLLLMPSVPAAQTGDRKGAQPAFVLHSLSLEPRGGSLVLDAFVAVRNVSSIEAGLLAGALLELRIRAELTARRALLPNRALAHAELLYQLRFDPLSREFALLRPGVPPLRQRHLPPLLTAALSDLSLRLPLEENLGPGKYRASLTMGLRQAEIPPMIEKTLFFWSWQVITPTTFNHDFVYETGQNK